MIPNIQLKKVRRNGKNTAYAVVDCDGVYKPAYYETIEEAVYHAIVNKSGDVIALGYKPRLVAFFSKYHGAMRFGFGAQEWEVRNYSTQLWWAEWGQMKNNYL